MNRYLQTDLSGTIRCMIVGVGLLGGTMGDSTELAMGAYTNPSHVMASGSPLSVDERYTLSAVNDDLSISGGIGFTINSTDASNPGRWLHVYTQGKNLDAPIDSYVQLLGGTVAIAGIDWSGEGGGAAEIGQITVTGLQHKPLRHRFLTTS